jgi:hypothetical protein
MPDHTFQDSREEMARREVGHTTVGKGTAWVLAIQFLLAVFCVPMSEVLHDGREGLGSRVSRLVGAVLAPARGEGSVWSSIVTRNRAVITELESFENGVEDASRLGRSLRPSTQYILTRLGAGNEQP